VSGLLRFVSKLDKIVYKVIAYQNIAMNTWRHARRKTAVQFNRVNNITYFSSVANGDQLDHWIQYQAGTYQIFHLEFDYAQCNLL
jgi:hypothetical protein